MSSELSPPRRVFQLRRRRPFDWGMVGPGRWVHLQRAAMGHTDIRWGTSAPTDRASLLESEWERRMHFSMYGAAPVSAVASSLATSRPVERRQYTIRFSVDGEVLEPTPAIIDQSVIERRRRLLAFRKRFVGERGDVTRLSQFSVDGSNSTTSLPPGVRLEESLPFRISEGPWVLCRCCAYAYNHRNSRRTSGCKDEELAGGHFVPGVTDKGTRRRAVWKERVKQVEYDQHLRRCCEENITVPHEVRVLWRLSRFALCAKPELTRFVF